MVEEAVEMEVPMVVVLVELECMVVVIDHPILIQEILSLQFQDCQGQNLLA